MNCPTSGRGDPAPISPGLIRNHSAPGMTTPVAGELFWRLFIQLSDFTYSSLSGVSASSRSTCPCSERLLRGNGRFLTRGPGSMIAKITTTTIPPIAIAAKTCQKRAPRAPGSTQTFTKWDISMTARFSRTTRHPRSQLEPSAGVRLPAGSWERRDSMVQSGQFLPGSRAGWLELDANPGASPRSDRPKSALFLAEPLPAQSWPILT